jgi:ribosomal protein L11 methyltransferase
MSDTLYTVVISTDAESGNIIDEMLPAIELFPTSYFDRDDASAHIYLYYETEEEMKEVLANVQASINGWQAIFNLDLSRLEIFSKEIEKEDWTETWKAFFHVIEVSERLVVKPSWEDYDEKPGQIILEIDPGMSFGTGNHGTTRACLEYLDEFAGDSAKSFMDMGSGSGILTMAASKLGYKDIAAFDYDEDAVRISKENFELSNCQGIDVFVQDLSLYKASGEYDFVIANILATVLVANADKIVPALKKSSESRLVLSGILHEQFDGVLEVFKKYGLKCIHRKQISEWSSGMLAFSS